MSPNMEKVIAEACEKIAHLRQDPLIKAEYEAKAKFIRDWRSEVEHYYQEGLFSEESLLVKRKIIDEAWENIAHLRQDPRIKAEYEAKAKFLRDWHSELEYHYQQGLEKGRNEERVLNAKRLIAEGISLEIVAECIDKPLAWVQNINMESESDEFF